MVETAKGNTAACLSCGLTRIQERESVFHFYNRGPRFVHMHTSIAALQQNLNNVDQALYNIGKRELTKKESVYRKKIKNGRVMFNLLEVGTIHQAPGSVKRWTTPKV